MDNGEQVLRAARSNPVALALIVKTPQWLKICVMKTSGLLCWVSHIKGGAWSNMVYVPPPVSVIEPCHTGFKKRFEVFLEFFNGTSEEFHRGVGFIDSREDLSDTCSEVYGQTKTDVCCQAFSTSDSCFSSGLGCTSANSVFFQKSVSVCLVSYLSCGFRRFGTRIFTCLLNHFLTVFKVVGSFDFSATRTAVSVNSESAMFALVELLERFVKITPSTFLFHRAMVSNAMMFWKI